MGFDGLWVSVTTWRCETGCEQLTCTPFTREGFGCLETMPHVKSSR